jgi:sugar phosphate isomerase/epimerase
MLGVNFDPANFIRYSTDDPVDALNRLAPRVFQVHVKDARPAATPEQQGEEVAMGEGSVNWPAIFEIVRRTGKTWDLLVERSAREDRMADIRKACDLVRNYLR